MRETVRHLTGITTTGTPHLGNYVGAIRPAIAASRAPGTEAFFFLADYHALVKCDDPGRVQRSRLEIAATWLAAGLDPQRVTFYRQSDIPEIPELAWLLTCVTAKGLMNRAHAYKAAVDANLAAGEDADAGIGLGLYSYPVLMAADILMFNAHRVPVGRDQVQHIEMARDIAQRFNHLFGGGRALFVLPQADIEDSVATLPGLDGRKMSKSYDNTIPLFEGGPRRLRDSILRIVTDSRAPGEPKDPDSSHLFTIFRAFADAAESAAMRAELADGLAWGEAKQRLYLRLEQEIAPMRARYEELMARPDEIEAVLQAGARNARAVAAPLLDTLRAAVGLRPFTREAALAKPAAANANANANVDANGNGNGNANVDANVDANANGNSNADVAAHAGADVRTVPPQFKQYRGEDGRFYFKLVNPDGRLLLQSVGFSSPREAGQLIGRLRSGASGMQVRDGSAWLDERIVGTPGEAVDAAALSRALVALATG